MTITEFTNEFIKFEDEMDMFSKSFDDFSYWSYMRFGIANDVRKYFGITFDPLKHKTELKNEKINLFRHLHIEHLKQIKNWEQRDILIIPHDRKYLDKDGYYRCIITNLIDQKLKTKHYILDDVDVNGLYPKQKSKNIIYFDYEVFNSNENFKSTRVTKYQFDNLFIKPLEDYFDIKFPTAQKNIWINRFDILADTYHRYVNYYNKVLDVIKPKVVIVVVGYTFNRMVLTECAKKRNIKVIEIQHGSIDVNHLAYNFYRKDNIITFPDYFFMFGKWRKNEIRFPITDDRVIPVGYPELEEESKKKYATDRGKRILFVSQLSEKIAEYAREVYFELNDLGYEITFKLHPKEYDDYKERYDSFFDDTNIQVVGSYNDTVYDLIRSSQWIVGVYSTVLQEALMFDSKIIIIKEDLYENSKDLYMNNFAKLASSPEEVSRIITENKVQYNDNVNNFFEKNSLEKMDISIEQILRGDI